MRDLRRKLCSQLSGEICADAKGSAVRSCSTPAVLDSTERWLFFSTRLLTSKDVLLFFFCSEQLAAGYPSWRLAPE